MLINVNKREMNNNRDFSEKFWNNFHFLVDEIIYCDIIIVVQFGGKPKQLLKTHEILNTQLEGG